MATEPDAADTGVLWLVATPIGNLEDLGDRARRVLAEADVVACEDTRVTAKLLARCGISARTLAYHEHNEQRQSTRLVEMLRSGKSVALVTDAGTPAVSDPGLVLVRKAREAGADVVPVPGPSAVLAALAASGLPPRPFTFIGFLPSRRGERRRALEAVATLPHTLVLFESARRLPASLRDMASTLGNRKAAVCRELTKLHEEILVDDLDSLASALEARDSVRGEITVVIGPPDENALAPTPSSLPGLADHWRRVQDETPDRKDALRRLARERNVSRRAVYRQLLDAGLMGDRDA